MLKKVWLWAIIGCLLFSAVGCAANEVPPIASNTQQSVMLGGVERDYKEVMFTIPNTAIAWRWEQMTNLERYHSVELNGVTYSARGAAIAQNLLGEKLGTGVAVGYDQYTEEQPRLTCDVYAIVGIAKENLVAVDLDGTFGVFIQRDNQTPATFGDWLSDYSLEAALPFELFTKYQGYDEKGSFQLTDDSGIWSVLAACGNSAAVDENKWDRKVGEMVAFTATAEVLGIRNLAFYVKSDGYIWTNLFEKAHVFDIGADAAGQIIAYANEHSQAADTAKFRQSVIGTVTAVEDGYILIDDAILCNTPDKHLVFKVSTDDIRIRRHVEMNLVKVGDTVQVPFDGTIDTANDNLVGGAYGIVDIRLEVDSESNDVPNQDTVTGVTVTTQWSRASAK